jgi:hypothetical protein
VRAAPWIAPLTAARMGRARLARERLAGGRQGRRRGEASGGRPQNQHMGGSVACARHGMGAVWLARAAGITARRGREDARGRDTRRRDARGRDSRVWEEDARRGQYRGRGHGWLVDALRCPLRISRYIYIYI